jgi:FdrA protein
MATAVNLEILEESGLRPEVDVAIDDLLLVVEAQSGSLAKNALGLVDEWLSSRGSSRAGEYRPHNLRSATAHLPEAGWVLVSVPGEWATRVAAEALDLGRNVLLYSDNVPLEDEVRLKRRAEDEGLLVLGPDCGTSIVGGVGLGFSNRARPGSVGIVGASGTGMQAVVSRLHGLGLGISHALGTGGRDLSAEIGGASTKRALDLLAADTDTEVIVLLSKPARQDGMVDLLGRARSCGKPVVVYLQGQPVPGKQLGSVYFARDLDEAADLAGDLAARPHQDDGPDPPLRSGYLRGLFAGGTLAMETLEAVRLLVTPLYSNMATNGVQPLPKRSSGNGHCILDLGADEYTLGRPHPMIDQSLRLEQLRAEAGDPEVGVVVLDVVLGDGSNADPAMELEPVIRDATASVDVLCWVVGTDLDPQELGAQISRLEAAGATVCTDGRTLISHLERRYRPAHHPLPEDLSALQPQAVINVGVEIFYDSLRAQQVSALQVDWQPPARGNARLLSILEKMRD